MSDQRIEHASAEVARWGPNVWLTIRSQESVGKSIALTPAEAEELATLLRRSASSSTRMVRDEPMAE